MNQLFVVLQDKVYSGSHGSIDMWSPKPEFNLVGKITHCYGSIHSMAVTSTYIIIGGSSQNALKIQLIMKLNICPFSTQ